ncbi:MAG: nucleotidyltransferase domain-containing protein [Deltaproteobacteria bacterium]|nr:nucleotidyltransferase domain-containing protein [Deltaproteobacteria bacterium]
MVPKGLLKKLQRLRQCIETARIPVSHLVLFGSRARGKPRRESDIDVCVVSPALGRMRIAEGVRLSLIAHEIDLLFEIVPCSLHDWRNDRRSPLLHEIRTTGIVL